MGHPTSSVRPEDQAASPEAWIAVAQGTEESPATKREGLEEMEPPVTATDIDLQTPADEGLSASKDKSIVTEETIKTPVDKDDLPVPEEKEIPPADNKEPIFTIADKEQTVIPADEESLPISEEHPTITTKEEEILGAFEVPSKALTDREHYPPTISEEPPPTTDKKQLQDEGKEEQLPSVADRESPSVATDKPDVLSTPTDKEGFTAIYRESPPAATTEAPSVPTDKGPLQVTSQEEPSSATAYRESPPTVTVEEHPSTMAYKEHPPAISVEEPPSIATEEVAGIIERISVVPEPVAVPPEPPAEVIEEVPAWEIWHTDPAEHVLLAVAITLVAGKAGGEVARLLKVPAVVGKIIMGMLLGNIYFLSGWDFLNFLRVMPFLKVLSDFGALTLLLSIGFRTDPRAILRVGLSSVLVALGGLVAPAGLGFLVGHFLLPDAPFNTKLFLSIVLCASSMGITFKILDDLKVLHTLEGRIITGAVILGDIVTLLAFGVVSGIVTSGRIPVWGAVITAGIMFLFISALGVTSLRYGESLGNLLTRKVPEGLKMSIVAVLCLLLAFLAESIGMHTIVGAFGAGLLLRSVRLKDSDSREYSIEWMIRPAYMLLVPIFFVRAGAQVRWESFLDTNTVILGLAITGASVLGKLFCSVCVAERDINRLAVGIAMIPKLEVTLVLATVGRSIGVLDDTIFSAFVMLIVLTSTVSPPFLKMILSRKKLVSEGPPVPFGEGVRVTSR